MDIFVEKSRELMREVGRNIEGTSIENMVRSYAEHVVTMETRLENEPDEYWESDDCPDWMYDNGYKTAMERWFRFIGISEHSNYVQSYIIEERERRKEDE